MARDQGSNRGRPAKGKEPLGEYVGFRASRELKKRLEESAKASNRSLSSEAQFRLELSFRDDRQLDLFGERYYGKPLATLFHLLEYVLADAAEKTEWAYKAAGEPRKFDPTGGRPNLWLTNRSVFDEMVRCAMQVFEAIAPPRDAEPAGEFQGWGPEWLQMPPPYERTAMIIRALSEEPPPDGTNPIEALPFGPYGDPEFAELHKDLAPLRDRIAAWAAKRMEMPE